MKKLLLLLTIAVCTTVSFGQNNIAEGTALLFKNVKTKITEKEKQEIYKSGGFLLSKDKKQFIPDADAAEYPFDANVYPTDMNGDGIEEIFIVFGNSYTSGMNGSSVILFIKNAKGEYKMNLGFASSTPGILPTKILGYPELVMGGPGFTFPVWKWNGKEYVFSRKISDKALTKLKTVYVDEASKKYVAKIK